MSNNENVDVVYRPEHKKELDGLYNLFLGYLSTIDLLKKVTVTGEDAAKLAAIQNFQSEQANSLRSVLRNHPCFEVWKQQHETLQKDGEE